MFADTFRREGGGCHSRSTGLVITEHHFRTTRTARFQLIGTPGVGVKTILYVLHGYGHLTLYFARKFEVLARPELLIVVPEGLHRFYLDKQHQRVGASWMTREDRETDIADQMEYLDGLHDHIMKQCPNAKETSVLGFSQGTATATRWLVKSRHNLKALVLWAGALPPDLSEGELGKLKQIPLHLVMGTQDEHYTEEQVAQHRAYLEQLGIQPRFTAFQGTHDIPEATLLQVLNHQ